MHIKKLYLKNFRRFEDATFEFKEGFNLLIGENGSGKSSVLEGVAESLVEWVPVAINQTTLDPSKDIRRVLSDIDFSKRYITQHPFICEASYEVPSDGNIKTNEIIGKTYTIANSGFSKSNLIREYLNKITNEDNKKISKNWTALPVVRYFSVNRNQIDGPLVVENLDVFSNIEPRFDGYIGAIAGRFDYRNLAKWFANKEFLRYERGADRSDDSSNDELAIVRRAIASCVDGCKTLNYIHGRMGLEVEWLNDTVMPFANLSDGQRIYIALVADIALRACALNVHLGKDVLKETPGIVLIDELDLHLHPKWQRSIVANLTKTFPKIQFIATTHSPQIIGECQPEQVIIVTDKGSQHPPESFGMDSNAVLREIMGADDRDKEINDLIDIMFSQIDERKLKAARASLEKLRAKKVRNLAEIIEAEHLIARFAREAPEAAE